MLCVLPAIAIGGIVDKSSISSCHGLVLCAQTTWALRLQKRLKVAFAKQTWLLEHTDFYSGSNQNLVSPLRLPQPTLHNGYPWLALLWGDIIKSSMQIQITRIGSGCRYYKACTTCNATEYLVLFWAFQSEFGTQKPDVVNASSSSLLLVPLMLLNSKETVFYMLEKRLRKRR